MSTTAETPNIFLFVPNLIGYGRIVLAFVAILLMPSFPVAASVSYFLSAFLDAFDGYAARLYNQGTRFGAMLDQLTDRLTFLALLMMLGQLYPRCLFIFQLTAIIDIASHWLHLHATDLTGKNTHKDSDNPILHYYYTSRPFLFFMCFGNEAFFSLLYIHAFYTGPAFLGVSFVSFLAFLTFPVAFVKQLISLVHLVVASQTIAEFDVAQRQLKSQ
uniref:CDP-diacylglycerol--inositol 3-phosphatidyltransferase n=1 Tax=Panagrellus redivivus TaxID=6233 RepID=A0A7E4VZI0_PANRE